MRDLFLKHEHKRDFFSWAVVSSESSSVTGHWPVHISCQHESPTNQRLLVYKSPTQPDPNIFMSASFFPSVSLTGSKQKISFFFVGVAIYPRGHQWELKRFHHCSSAERITVSFEFVSLFLQWFRFPACHHGHASSYFLFSLWQAKSIVDTAVYRDAASVRDQQN